MGEMGWDRSGKINLKTDLTELVWPGLWCYVCARSLVKYILNFKYTENRKWKSYTTNRKWKSLIVWPGVWCHESERGDRFGKMPVWKSFDHSEEKLGNLSATEKKSFENLSATEKKIPQSCTVMR